MYLIFYSIPRRRSLLKTYIANTIAHWWKWKLTLGTNPRPGYPAQNWMTLVHREFECFHYWIEFVKVRDWTSTNEIEGPKFGKWTVGTTGSEKTHENECPMMNFAAFLTNSAGKTYIMSIISLFEIKCTVKAIINGPNTDPILKKSDPSTLYFGFS